MRACFWETKDFPAICDRLIAWVEKTKGVDIDKVNGERPKKDTATEPAGEPDPFLSGTTSAKPNNAGGDGSRTAVAVPATKGDDDFFSTGPAADDPDPFLAGGSDSS